VLQRRIKESNPRVSPRPGIRHRLPTIQRYPPSRRAGGSNTTARAVIGLAIRLRHQTRTLQYQESRLDRSRKHNRVAYMRMILA